jgi:hypothetical protein
MAAIGRRRKDSRVEESKEAEFGQEPPFAYGSFSEGNFGTCATAIYKEETVASSLELATLGQNLLCSAVAQFHGD